MKTARQLSKPTRYLAEWMGLTAVVLAVAVPLAPPLVWTAAAGLWVAFYTVWIGRLAAMPPRRVLRRVANAVKGRDPGWRPKVSHFVRDKAMRNRAGRPKRCRTCFVAPSEHLEHVWSRSWGGPDKVWNFRAGCAPCNLSLGADVTRRGMAVMLVPGTADWLVYVLWPFGIALVVLLKGSPL